MKKIAILGAGNIGQAIYKGLVQSGELKPEQIILSNTNITLIEAYKNDGCSITDNNQEAVIFADTLILCVEPQQMNRLLDQIRPSIDEKKCTFCGRCAILSCWR